jgi:hypothetical protein
VDKTDVDGSIGGVVKNLHSVGKERLRAFSDGLEWVFDA